MPSRRPTQSHGTLLLAGAGAGALVLTLGVYLMTSHTHPMAQRLASLHAPAAPVLAPSASLANVAVPSHQPVVLPHYDPIPRNQQLGELLALQSGGRGAPPVAVPRPVRQPEAVATVTPKPPAYSAAPVATAAPDHPAAQPVAVATQGPPLGLVVQEPGAQAARPLAAVAPAVVAAATVPSRQVSSEPGSGATTRATTPPAGSDTTAAATSAAGSTVAQDGTSQESDPKQAQATKPGSTQIAATLPDEQQLLGMITQLGYAMHDLQRRNLRLQTDMARLSAAATTHLADDERRIALMEAGRSVAAAGEATEATDMPATRTASPPMMRTISFNNAVPTEARTYRVQAASPGLAMLAEVDRGGGDGAQIQIQVGDDLPGYGRVRTIKQQGTAWVVATDRGQIQ